jgi:hypothetical protein
MIGTNLLSQYFDKACRSQSLNNERDRYQPCEDKAEDTTPIAMDTIATIGIGDNDKDGIGTALSRSSSSVENQSSFAKIISQSVVDQDEE